MVVLLTALVSTVARADDKSPCPGPDCLAVADAWFADEVWAKVGVMECIKCHKQGGDAEDSQLLLRELVLALNDSTAAHRGEVVGTPNYMSPEQATGEGHRIDGRTDIYALGVILYRMLSGQLPFAAASISELLQKVVEDEPRPPRQFVTGIPRDLEKVCLKAMAKKINDRYTTASDMAEDLRALIRSTEQPTISGTKRAVARGRSKRDVPRERPKPKGGVKILIAEDHELT